MKFLGILAVFFFFAFNVSGKNPNEADIIPAKAESPYTPWYTGPLLAGSGNNQPKATICFQPYIFTTYVYGHYENNWSSHSSTKSVIINPSFFFSTGITDWLDTSISWNLFETIKFGDEGWNRFEFGDTTASLGFQLCKASDTSALPSIRFVFREGFPTGNYEAETARYTPILNGTGTYCSQFFLTASKVVFWLKNHPMNLRTNIGYSINAPVHVIGYNTYGGGIGTNGIITPGSVFTFLGSFEFSFTQQFAFAMDFYYTHQWLTKFKGYPGINPDGSVATFSGTTHSLDQFSLTPSLEYNFNQNFGILLASWFTFAGRNCSKFGAGTLSIVYNY